MPGKRITDQQVEIYMKNRKAGYKQITAAAKAGISERSGRNIEHGRRKSILTSHNWTTRRDPLQGAFEKDLLPLLEQNPKITPITLLEELQRLHPDKYTDQVLRTLQRRVKKWKALYGPEKEVIFQQIHKPGLQGLSDFTHLKETITIKGKPLEHLLYHFRLAFSGWSYVKAILGGESYTALSEGLQEALWRLGGSPKEHRTDSLSAAFKNLNKDEQLDITNRYQQFCDHYCMKATRNNPGVPEENGSIESSHGHVKRRIYQALILRKSNDFESIEAYQQFIDEVVYYHNRRNAPLISLDKAALTPLPNYKTIDYTEHLVKVTTSSTISIKRVTYTVPSQLIGETLRVHIYHDRINCYVGSELVIILKRVYSNGQNYKRSIDYRHVIHSLVKKPQAFRYSQIRDDLLPNDDYRTIWEYADQNMPSKQACRLIVGLLKLAAYKNCETSLAQDVLICIREHQPIHLNELEKRYESIVSTSTNLTAVKVDQHALSDYDQLLDRGGVA